MLVPLQPTKLLLYSALHTDSNQRLLRAVQVLSTTAVRNRHRSLLPITYRCGSEPSHSHNASSEKLRVVPCWPKFGYSRTTKVRRNNEWSKQKQKPKVNTASLLLHVGRILELQSTSFLQLDANSVYRTWKCELPNCSSTANFTRLADFQRHQSTVHEVGTPRYPCTFQDCTRVGDKGFTRRDHLVEHLRNFHHIDIPKRRPGERSAYPFGRM
jgi:hypothetical protein